LDHTSVPAKWHLIPSTNVTDIQTDPATGLSVAKGAGGIIAFSEAALKVLDEMLMCRFWLTACF